MRVVPQSFYQNPNIDKFLVNGLSCVVLKQAHKPDLNNERYVAAHALTLVQKGTLRIKSYEGQECLVPENKMVFLPRGLYMISDIIPKNQPFQATVFFFNEEVIQEFLAAWSLLEIKPVQEWPLILDYTDPIRSFTENLGRIYGPQKSVHKALSTIKLLELLHIITSSEAGQKFLHLLAAIHQQPKRDIREFMKLYFDKPLSVEDYAYLTGRSLSTFQRDFKRQFHSSPKQWLIDKRLEKACKLLSNNDFNVTDTAYEVGYENISHFIKAFRRKYKISPKQFMIQRRDEITL